MASADGPQRGRILVTGASGFVGGALVDRALTLGHEVVAVVRPGKIVSRRGLSTAVVEDIGDSPAWESTLRDVDIVIHAAARAHVMNDGATDPLAEFRRINTAGTLCLARAAAHSGVRRFVFVSSIKVNGERTAPGCPFRPSDQPAPQDPYGVSKAEAEQGLAEVATRSCMEVAIVRPPLVYGPGVRANFLSLLRLVDRGIPLPLASVDNRRSLIGVHNLVDLLLRCATHRQAAGRIFLATDGDSPSIGTLVRAIAAALQSPPRLWPVPPGALKLLGSLLGRSDQVSRLCDSLEVDGADLEKHLGWSAPQSLQVGIDDTVRWYRERRDGKLQIRTMQR